MNDLTLTPMAGNAAATSDAAKAMAEVHAALSIAKANPRNQLTAIDNIKNTFTRVMLAEVAQYQYARGGTDIVGPSIRSAEAIAQLWGNIQFGFRELSRGIDERGIGYSEVEAYAWDLETNTKRPTTFVVKHWRDTQSGGYALKSERDIYEVVASTAQRRVRSSILAIIPCDVVDIAMRQVAVTLKASADTSPEAIKKIVETFADFGVTKAMIEIRIQRRIDSIQPAQVISLKRIYMSLRDGMSESRDWFETDDESPKAEEVDHVLPSMSDDVFCDNITVAKSLILGKKKTAQQVTDMLATKYTLSEDQENEISALEELIEDENDITADKKRLDY